MISREPTIERLVIARSLLLEPFGLTDATLASALGAIATHRIDDADLYFQYTRSEGWSLEEGIVKSGSFGIDQGVGVRAVAGEKTAFAYSDDISEAALMDAARTVRTIAANGQSRKVKVGVKQHVARAACCMRRWTRSPRSTAPRRSRCSRRSRSWRAPRIRVSCR
jgi:TldD protein